MKVSLHSGVNLPPRPHPTWKPKQAPGKSGPLSIAFLPAGHTQRAPDLIRKNISGTKKKKKKKCNRKLLAHRGCANMRGKKGSLQDKHFFLGEEFCYEGCWEKHVLIEQKRRISEKDSALDH